MAPKSLPALLLFAALTAAQVFASATSDAAIVQLFNSATPLEPATIENTSTALITRVGDGKLPFKK